MRDKEEPCRMQYMYCLLVVASLLLLLLLLLLLVNKDKEPSNTRGRDVSSPKGGMLSIKAIIGGTSPIVAVAMDSTVAGPYCLLFAVGVWQ